MKQRNAAKWWFGLLFGLTLILTAAMPVQAAKQKVVEKKLSAWQSFKMKAGGFSIVILLIVMLYTIFTNSLKLKSL